MLFEDAAIDELNSIFNLTFSISSMPKLGSTNNTNSYLEIYFLNKKCY